MLILRGAAAAGLTWSSLVVFGDSLSDNGNGSYALTNRTWPADPAYFQGRFSNGPVWVDYLSDLLGIPGVEDYAYGGATINNSKIAGFTGPASTIPVPSTTDQVASYLHQQRPAGAAMAAESREEETNQNRRRRRRNKDKLFVVSGGNNDAFFLTPDQDPVESARAVAADLLASTRKIYDAGGRYFVIPTNYCLQKTPYTIAQHNDSTVETLNDFRRAFSQYIKRHVKHAIPSNADVTIFESCQNLERILRHPKRFGFTETSKACLQGVYAGEAPTRSLCENPDKYVFWDVFHPTTKTHKLLAKDAYNVIMHRTYAA